MKKIIIVVLILCQIVLSSPRVALADYRYDEYGKTIPAQASFRASGNYNGKQLGTGDFKNPTDVFVDDDNKLIYVLDAGNSRIVVLNEDFEVEKVIDEVKNGNEIEVFEEAKGLFVDEKGTIYIADGKNQRVLVTDKNGTVTGIIKRPASNLLADNITFLPRNVILDLTGIVYIISEQSTQGAYMISPNNEFLGFYGRNNVNLTADLFFKAALRRFATKEQRAKMENFIPVEFSNFDVDQEGFIYTVTSTATNPKNFDMIRKLNPLGQNVLNNMYRVWGDEPDGARYRTSYIDMAVDKNGFIYTLDSYSGRIFQYDNEGFQLSILGGIGSGLGYFTVPTAIETLDNKIIVLDSKKANLTVFEQTSFGELLVKGMIRYNSGNLEESLTYFKEMIKMDANFSFAYYAIADAYYEMGNYKLAAEYGRMNEVGSDVYSKAKKEIRNEWMRDQFALIFFGIIAVFFMIIVASHLAKTKSKHGKSLMRNREG